VFESAGAVIVILITRSDFPKGRSYLVHNIYEPPAQIPTDEGTKVTQIDLYVAISDGV
jgi:hypothetical protein